MGDRIDKRSNTFLYARSSLRPAVAFPPLGGGHEAITAVQNGKILNTDAQCAPLQDKILSIVRYSIIFSACSASYTSSDGVCRHLLFKGKALGRDFFLRNTTFVGFSGSRWPLKTIGSTFPSVRKHSPLCPKQPFGAERQRFCHTYNAVKIFEGFGELFIKSSPRKSPALYIIPKR